jgi:peptidoglycan/xylan/chitin deacetylase (PgdA/CDA1 family)
MTLLVLRYHRARAGMDGNSPEMLDAHFGYIAEHFVNVLPGETLPVDRDAVCLTFDGAYFDFYAEAFPLLKKHGLRAVVAVAPAVIRDKPPGSAQQRMQIAADDAYMRPDCGGFCTWEELQEIARSGIVSFAAHGYMHTALDDPEADLETEVHVPRTLLAARLHVPVESFVLPFGRSNGEAVHEIRSSYAHVFANGEASNGNWDARLLYRVTCDNLRAPTDPFAPGRMMAYRARSLWRRVRRR